MAGEIFTSMEFRKFLSEDITSGTDKITYLGYADYYQESPVPNDGYAVVGDKARAIRRIKKIVEDTVAKTTETYYPDGDPDKTFKWTERAGLNYI